MRLRLKLSLSESLNLELKKYGGVADRVFFFFLIVLRGELLNDGYPKPYLSQKMHF